MVHKPTLWMLVGVPGSGKSTFVASQIDNEADREGIYIASTDQYIEDKARFYNMTYDSLFQMEIKNAEKHMYDGVMKATALNYDIIWDQTNLNRKSRGRKLIMIPDNYEKIAVVFPTPEREELELRLASRPGKTIPWGIMETMIKTMTYPTADEGFDHVMLYEEHMLYV